MDTARWATLSALLDDLLELPPDAREARLAELAATDAGMADELRRMIALEDERPDFLSESFVDASVFSPQPGQQIGPYRLESPLGEGGMGQVWLATRADGLYQRRVALKLLRPGLGDAGLRTRFTRERQILARLGHAHIARLLDAGVSSDGQPYLALDYVQGEPITDYARKLSLGVPERLHLFLQVCAAVSHAHANLVVHRDLKPSNILVTPAGEVCLLDFGIAKLLDEAAINTTEITGTGTRAFTLHYAAPEQLRNGVITTMTDVYALGVVLYELLVGRKPYDPARTSDAAWEEAILTADAVRPSLAAGRVARDGGSPLQRRIARELAGDLDNILLRALAKLPDDRYVSVEALAQDLRRYLGGEPVSARSQSLGYRARKFLRRNSLPILASAWRGCCWCRRWRSRCGRRGARWSRPNARRRCRISSSRCSRTPTSPAPARASTCARCWTPACAAPTPNCWRSRRRAPNCWASSPACARAWATTARRWSCWTGSRRCWPGSPANRRSASRWRPRRCAAAVCARWASRKCACVR